MALSDLAPIGHGRAAKRIGADTDAGVADGVQVQHVGQVVDIGGQVVEPARRRMRLGEGDATDLGQAVFDQLVGAGGDGGCGLAPAGPPEGDCI